MKSVTIIYNGAADKPVGEISDRTPLEVIRAENVNRIAASGQAGILDLPAGAGHQLLAELLGIPADVAATLKRAPLWAASLHEEFSGFDFAYCASFVTVDNDELLTGPRVAHLSFEETKALAKAVEEELSGEVRVRAIAPSQAVLLCRAEGLELKPGSAPVTQIGTRVDKYLSRFKKESQKVAEWMRLSGAALDNHFVNEVRVDLGENPANLLWLWEGGTILPPAETNPNATLLTNSPMAAGIASLLDIPVLPLSDPWTMDADGDAFHMPDIVRSLREKDRLFVYVESPGCAGTFGPLSEKLRMLEAVDHRLLTPLEPILEANRPYRVAVLSDSVVSTEEGVPVKGPVPVVLAGEGITRDEVQRWSEADCRNGALGTITRSMLSHITGA
ncbi:hypothetical protein ACFLQY_01575 [Verrucomicrobiota bacterium]